MIKICTPLSKNKYGDRTFQHFSSIFINNHFINNNFFNNNYDLNNEKLKKNYKNLEINNTNKQFFYFLNFKKHLLKNLTILYDEFKENFQNYDLNYVKYFYSKMY